MFPTRTGPSGALALALAFALPAAGAGGCTNCNGTINPGDSSAGDGGGADGASSSDGNVPSCPGGTDSDGDGHGDGCPAGGDCDDFNFTIYDGAPELCDMLDNDCDLQVDEGALNTCGTCNPNCGTSTVGTDPFPQPADSPPPPNVESNGVSNDPNGDVVLDSSSIEFHFAYIANYQEGTVSKLDTDDGREVARYDSVRLADVPTARPPQESCSWCAGGVCTGNCPSRTAVDFNGDVWVANRAFGNQGTASKVANESSECIDRNGDLAITTSSDQNGNGVIDVDCDGNGVFDTAATVCTNGLPPEFVGQDDECILFTVAIGGVDSVPRALAIDAGGGAGTFGNAWVGAYNEGAFYKLDGATGTVLARVPATGSLGLSPYGAAIDSTGKLWAPNGCCGSPTIIDIDTATATAGTLRSPPAGVLPCAGSYGIAVDGADDVWIGAYPCAGAIVYEPAANLWTYVDTGPAGYSARGVAADGFGQLWVALHAANPSAAAARIDIATRTVIDTWDITSATGGSIPVGIGIAFDSSIWAVDQATSSAARIYVDPTTGAPATHPTTGNVIDEFPVGLEPYTYSDFTGFGLRNFTNPNGTYEYWLEGCPDPEQATWLRVEWSATEPPGTSISIRVRTADTVAGLDTATTYGSWTTSPAYLDVAPGPLAPNPARFIEVVFDLQTTDPTTTPVLHDFNIVWECPNPIG